MKKHLDSVKVAAIVLLVAVIGLGVYFFLFLGAPSSNELEGISTGVEPLPDISFSSPAFTELDVRQKFGPVPLQVAGSDVGRVQPFSEP